ncbi:hypothetical protein [Cupriavidus numazuensis]|uniref:hypothetical protein n=1 Tax=Cupriavidus numazuensis TaxID=221992 RepID=UPI001FD0F18A|nr:hypothetical protein [Cupriavidus numazuensis]
MLGNAHAWPMWSSSSWPENQYASFEQRFPFSRSMPKDRLDPGAFERQQFALAESVVAPRLRRIRR